MSDPRLKIAKDDDPYAPWCVVYTDAELGDVPLVCAPTKADMQEWMDTHELPLDFELGEGCMATIRYTGPDAHEAAWTERMNQKMRDKKRS